MADFMHKDRVEMAAAERDRKALVILRVSLARVAQAAQVPFKDIVQGLPDDANFQMLHHAASTQERGWNALACIVTDKLVREREQAERARADICREPGEMG